MQCVRRPYHQPHGSRSDSGGVRPAYVDLPVAIYVREEEAERMNAPT